jgi:hypothetical protein
VSPGGDRQREAFRRLARTRFLRESEKEHPASCLSGRQGRSEGEGDVGEGSLQILARGDPVGGHLIVLEELAECLPRRAHQEALAAFIPSLDARAMYFDRRVAPIHHLQMERQQAG